MTVSDILLTSLKYNLKYTRDHLDGKVGMNTIGSYFDHDNVWDLFHDLLSADWEPFEHPAVREGTYALRANIPGNLGLINLHDCMESDWVTISDEHGVGKLSASISEELVDPGLKRVDYSIIIIGPMECVTGETVDVMYTVHPGDPIRPSVLEGTDTVYVPATEAISMGFDLAKIERSHYNVVDDLKKFDAWVNSSEE